MDIMIIFSVVFLLLGVALVCIEIFMPGFGVFGIAGVIFLVLSAILTILAVPFGFFVLIAEFTVLVGFFAIAFQYIRKQQLHGKLILNDTSEYEKKEISQQTNYMGKEGVTKTVLKPYGTADFGGNIVDVWSEGVLIDKGKRIKIIRTDGQKFFAEEIKLQ